MTEKEAQKVLDELNTVRIEVLNGEAKRLFEAIMKIADNRDELQKMIERKDFEISSLKQVHDYDTKMIDDVKGKAVELYDRIEEKDKTIEQQKEQIDYLRRSCERKEECLIEEQQENAELKNKLKENDKIIDLMAEEISKNITNTCPFADYNYDLDCKNKCNDNYKECWKQYFENKSKEV